MNFEDICLLVLVLQGFLVCFWEYKVYKIHNDRFKERKQWRAAKEKAKLKKTEQLTTDVRIQDQQHKGPSTV